MRHYTKIIGVMLVTIGIITFPSKETQEVSAIGCDTYERIRGEIGSCTGGTTEYSRELWVERYRVCLKEQLSREIALYDSKVEASYAEWDRNSEQDMNLENISLQDENIQPLAISQMKSSTLRANNDLCN